MRRDISFRQTLMLNQAPIWVFSVLIVGVTFAVLDQAATRVSTLEARLRTGSLTAEHLQAAENDLQMVWLVSLAAFLGFASLASALSVVVYRHVDRRADRLALYLDETASGRDPGDIPIVGNDALARVERSSVDVAKTVAARERQQAQEAQQARFDAMLQRAMELADTEEEAVATAGRAMERLLDRPHEVLLAMPGGEHLHRRLGEGDRVCGAVRTRDCAAMRAGRALVFPSTGALDACPQVHASDWPSSLVCNPITILGRSIGVITILGDIGDPPGEVAIHQLQAVANHTGRRVSALRMLAATSSDGKHDDPKRPSTSSPH